MYDKSLVTDILTQIIDALEIVDERCSAINDVDDLVDTKEGQERLDGICMKLIAVGESLKNIDHITDRKLLSRYPEIEWKKVKGIRDFISHHYFDLDAEIIYGICKNNIADLLRVLKKIRKEIA